MDRAYEGDKNRRQAVAMGMDALVFPLESRQDSLAIGEGVIQEAQRGGAVIQVLEELLPGFLPLGQTGWDFYGVHCIRPHL